MLLIDPPPSQGDLHFRLFGFPVRVHPWFWIATVIFGLGGGQRETAPSELLTWVAVVFVSILVHELGHAFVQRYYGGHPRITLHAMGGFAACSDCDRRSVPQIIISLAGPVAGFLLVAALVAAFYAAGRLAVWTPDRPAPWNREAIEASVAYEIFGRLIFWQPLASPVANRAVLYLVGANIFWGLLNLLPVYPLDGGRVAREICVLASPSRGVVASLWLSTIAGAACAAYALISWREWFAAAFFAYLAYGSFTTIGAYKQSRGWP